MIPDGNNNFVLGTAANRRNTVFGAIGDFSNAINLGTGTALLNVFTTTAAVGTAPAGLNVSFDVVGTENYVFGGNLLPRDNNSLNLGSTTGRWAGIYGTNLDLNGTARIGSIPQTSASGVAPAVTTIYPVFADGSGNVVQQPQGGTNVGVRYHAAIPLHGSCKHCG